MSEMMLTRSFDAEVLEVGDGRTIEALIVPYDTPTTVADPPDFMPYEELFERGAFDRQLRAADRVKIWLNFEHEQGLRGIVGHGTELIDRDNGLHGIFRVHRNDDGEKALELVNEGVASGISLEYLPLRSRTVGGVIHRLRAHLDRVSLVRQGAWAGAAVLAVRSEPLLEEEELAKLERLGFNPELAASLEELGLEVPDRLKTTPTQ